MEIKYNILIRILDSICREAPVTFTSYHNLTNEDKITNARSRAFIHLLLKVRFGILKFSERENLITDGTQDGGVDAYFIDKENKKLYFIQSKFRTKPDNFSNKCISADDLIKMEIKKITEGKPADGRGVEFNTKIKDFIKEYSNLENHARYKFQIIFLGNLRNYTEEQIRKLTDGFEYEEYNFERTYKELIYSLCSGLHYKPEDIYITLNLSNKLNPILMQTISTEQGNFDVRITFVPAKEIGMIMEQYKNSLLRYNPRNYLTISDNPVNKKIAESITKQKNNDFAILNNGITILANYFNFSQGTGRENRGQIVMTNPQIINGGQTAYTLGSIYESYKDKPDDPFGDKEVLIKVIVAENTESLDPKFINNISNATNQQTRVDEADRRANSEIQIKLQGLIFEKFGYYYERKKGEFYPGVSLDYIDKELVVNRDNFLRAYYGSKGFPADARRAGSDALFSESKFKSILDNYEDYKKMFFSFLLHKNLSRLKRENWGYGIRYGKFAIVYAILLNCNIEEFSVEEYEKIAREKIEEMQKNWKRFEKTIRKKPSNKDYFEDRNFDFDGYYKGKNLTQDIDNFFKVAKTKSKEK